MKTRKLVTLYNEALDDKEVSKEEVAAIDELLNDQRDWEFKNWKQGFGIGIITAVVGTYLGELASRKGEDKK